MSYSINSYSSQYGQCSSSTQSLDDLLQFFIVAGFHWLTPHLFSIIHHNSSQNQLCLSSFSQQKNGVEGHQNHPKLSTSFRSFYKVLYNAQTRCFIASHLHNSLQYLRAGTTLTCQSKHNNHSPSVPTPICNNCNMQCLLLLQQLVGSISHALVFFIIYTYTKCTIRLVSQSKQHCCVFPSTHLMYYSCYCYCHHSPPSVLSCSEVCRW